MEQAAVAVQIGAGPDRRAEGGRPSRGEPAGAAVATLCAAFMLSAAGLTFVLVPFVFYAPATILFVIARREQGRRLSFPRELVVLAVSVVGAVAGVVALAAGWISR